MNSYSSAWALRFDDFRDGLFEIQSIGALQQTVRNSSRILILVLTTSMMSSTIRVFAVVSLVALSLLSSCSEPPLSPEKALSVLVSNPIVSEDSVGPKLVGKPTYIVMTAKSDSPSHYATIKGTMEMESHKARYDFSLTGFFKEGKWYYDPTGPMFLDQIGDPWSSSDPAEAGHLCKMVALYCIGLRQ